LYSGKKEKNTKRTSARGRKKGKKDRKQNGLRSPQARKKKGKL